jgi:hypothetical protein
LCGELHALRVHGYPLRRVRDRERQINDTIRVVVIRCETARAAGNPYTTRLLPDFLVPGCLMRLDHLEEAYHQKQAGVGTDQLCGILGCLDERTLRGHLKRYSEALAAAALRLAETRAMSPQLGELPHSAPDIPSVERLQGLWQAEQAASQRRGEALKPMSLRYLLQAALGKCRRQKPSSCVSVDARPP